ncbi:MAG: UMP kinase [Desulfurococcales archaeon]|nr:UMP kinase [Desulfurococcales archaeon]
MHERGEPLAPIGSLIVVKLSGRLLYPPSADYIAGITRVVSEIEGMGFKVGFVVGGGELARSYIEALRRLGLNEGLLDLMGIEASRLNASMLSKALYPRSPPVPITSIEEALRVVQIGLIPVMGGLQPGQSTNAVAASLAEAGGGSVVLNALRGVEGVYEDEPGGRILRKLSYDDMERIIEGFERKAGTYTLWDRVALDIVRRSNIKVVFFDGSNPRNFIEALMGIKGSILGVEGGE